MSLSRNETEINPNFFKIINRLTENSNTTNNFNIILDDIISNKRDLLELSSNMQQIIKQITNFDNNSDYNQIFGNLLRYSIECNIKISKLGNQIRKLEKSSVKIIKENKELNKLKVNQLLENISPKNKSLNKKRRSRSRSRSRKSRRSRSRSRDRMHKKKSLRVNIPTDPRLKRSRSPEWKRPNVSPKLPLRMSKKGILEIPKKINKFPERKIGTIIEVRREASSFIKGWVIQTEDKKKYYLDYKRILGNYREKESFKVNQTKINFIPIKNPNVGTNPWIYDYCSDSYIVSI